MAGNFALRTSDAQAVGEQANTEEKLIRAVRLALDRTGVLRRNGQAKTLIVHSLLFLRDMPQDEVQQNPGGHGADLVVETALAQRPLECRTGIRRPQPQSDRAGHNLSAITIAQKCITQRTRGTLDRLGERFVMNSRGSGRDNGVSELGQEGLFIRKMPVERTRRHSQVCCEVAHGQLGEPSIIEDTQRRFGHIRPRMAAGSFRFNHVSTIVNIVQVNGVQERVSVSSQTHDHHPRARRIESADIARVAVMAALIAALGLPGSVTLATGVPITAQTLGVMLAGAILGPSLGALAVGVFLALLAIGLPVLAGGRGGIGVFFGPTGGYLAGFLVGAIFIGLIVHAGGRKPQWWRTGLAMVLGGIVTIYALGIPVQSVVTRLPLPQTALSSLLFVPGDLIKATIATSITMVLVRAYPRAFRRSWATAPRMVNESDAAPLVHTTPR